MNAAIADWDDDTDSEPTIFSTDEEPDLDGLSPCPTCHGAGLIRTDKGHKWCNDTLCPECRGDGFHGEIPLGPTGARPGSTLKIAIISARYAAGLPLFDADDALHGPMTDDELRL